MGRLFTLEKRCRVCLETKPNAEMATSGKSKYGIRKAATLCKSCNNRRIREARKANLTPERQAERERIVDRKRDKIWEKYGITRHEINIRKALQNNTCLICKLKTDKLVVDHCHTSGKFRGLICNNCNIALGSFKDNINNLIMAIKYLQKNGKIN